MQKNGKVGTVMGFDQVSLALSGLLTGKNDAVMFDEHPMLYHAHHSPGKFRVLEDSFGEFDIAVGARPEDKELIQKINQTLAEMRKDGTYQKVYEKWFG